MKLFETVSVILKNFQVLRGDNKRGEGNRVQGGTVQFDGAVAVEGDLGEGNGHSEAGLLGEDVSAEVGHTAERIAGGIELNSN